MFTRIIIMCTVPIDNHWSGYLGMAGCFNVYWRFPVSIERLITQLRKGSKTNLASEISNLYTWSFMY